MGQGSGFRVQGSGFRVPGSGFRVQGLGFRVYPVTSGGDPPCTTSTLMPGACAQMIVVARCPALKTSLRELVSLVMYDSG